MITCCFSTSLPPPSPVNLLLQIPQQIYFVGLQQQDKTVCKDANWIQMMGTVYLSAKVHDLGIKEEQN